ncbi:hypothetical protein AALO_G00095500 [Alosa alosa]|uniref:Secreted protein n=1 Tax=Alosa alosa TaxID=278164 RepID=A0AAV6GSJ8_9TELE|nr:hypothetical protein AALO_G00095500 [Alosa alosa]
MCYELTRQVKCYRNTMCILLVFLVFLFFFSLFSGSPRPKIANAGISNNPLPREGATEEKDTPFLCVFVCQTTKILTPKP